MEGRSRRGGVERYHVILEQTWHRGTLSLFALIPFKPKPTPPNQTQPNSTQPKHSPVPKHIVIKPHLFFTTMLYLMRHRTSDAPACSNAHSFPAIPDYYELVYLSGANRSHGWLDKVFRFTI